MGENPSTAVPDKAEAGERSITGRTRPRATSALTRLRIRQPLETLEATAPIGSVHAVGSHIYARRTVPMFRAA
jgi:hypothetical protein